MAALVSDAGFRTILRIPMHSCCKNQPWEGETYTLQHSQILRYIQSARKSIDVCVYSITSSELADVIVQLSKLGVQVRVVTDYEQLGATGSQVGLFRMEGIQVRHNEGSYLMHHKFLIIDNQILITGSLNWTRQAIVGNSENLVVTTDPKLLLDYHDQFEQLWVTFDPKHRT